MKKAFTLVEIFVVIFLLLVVTSLVVPMALNDSKKAQEISSWRHTYSDVVSIFKSLYVLYLLKEENREEIEHSLELAKTDKQKEQVLIEEFASYLRIVSKFDSKNYKITYLNGDKVSPKNYYYFDNFYLTHSDEIIGVKWIGELYGEKSPLALLLFDINGEKAPNVWGKDIFGVTMTRLGLEPFGEGVSLDEIKSDCSKKGRGVYCSYEYLIGAQF